MYTLEELRDKTFKELKEIGYQLNVLPERDRRCSQNWIDAIVGVNPPLLKLLETSPSVDRPPNRLIEEIDFAEFGELTFFKLIELCRNTDKHLEDKSLKQLQHIRTKILDLTARPSASVFLGNKTHRASWVREIRHQLTFLVQTRSLVKVPRGLGRVEELLWKRPIIEDFDALLLHVQFFPEKDATSEIEIQAQEPIELQAQEPIELQAQEPIELQAQEPIEIQAQEPIEIQAQEPIEVQAQEPPIKSKFGRIVYPKPATEPIAQVSENSPGVSRKTSTAHQLLELFKSSARILEPIDIQRLEPIEIQRLEPIENSPGVTFSTHFLASYSPPQSESIRYRADGDGQLNLLEYEIESVDEPPDFDDYSTEFEFWAAYDAWCDRNPDDFESLDAFSELPTDPDAENSESLAVGVDSMREWAPCPDDWYEPTPEILPSEASSMEVMELSPAIETIQSSSTCEFLLPFFGSACDRQNDKDEPPGAGSLARLPKPRPPSFPPRTVVASDRTNRIKKFARSAIPLSGRDPPGGDASF